MARSANREVLQGFIEEAKSYLPTVLNMISAFRVNADRLDALEEAHRLVHTIKGAAAMVGLAGLSHIAYTLEEALEQVAAGQLPMDDQVTAVFHKTVAQIGEYLDCAWNGRVDERSFLTDVTVSFRRLRGLPESEDTAALQQVLAEVVPETAPPAEERPSPPRPPVEGFRAEETSPELVEAFSTEAEDHLRQIGTRLAELEKQPNQKEKIQDVRRSAHTLKGAAGAMGFRAIAQLTHRMEDLLDLLYEGALSPTTETIALLLTSNDALEDLVTGQFEEAAMQETLQDLYARYSTWIPQTPPQLVEAGPALGTDVPSEELITDLATLRVGDPKTAERPAAPAARSSGQVVRAPIERLDELVRLVSEQAISRTTFEQRMTDFTRMVEDLHASADRLRRVSTNLETQYEASTLGGRWSPTAAGVGPQVTPTAAREFDALEFDQYTEFHRLSRELTEASSDIRTISGELSTLVGDFDGILVRQGRLSSELQDKLMRVRMVPLATLATRLHRAVRTVAHDQGKSVDLVLQGEQIELDKTVLEEMADPLLHLLRNAVDHGVEPPALRRVIGKPERGTILLKAFHEGNQVVLQVSDDGAGLDPQILRAAAVRGGYLSETDAAQLSDEELHALIFVPGYSTSKQVSEVSGRGVGLDIVKTNVHKLKGTLTVDSKPGQGATFTIRLPMTLAVMRALLVKANSETFAIPQNAITQIVRMEKRDIERVGQEPVIRIGGHVYPVQHLGQALKLKQSAEDTAQRLPVLIMQAGSEQIALVVDELVTGREIVIKGLGNHLRRVQGITGATLMGDGTVVLIINPMDLLTQAAKPEVGTTPHGPAASVPGTRQTWSIMVVDDSLSVRRVVSNLIRSAGWQSIPAKDGLEALEIIQRSTPPDLILLDIEMPRMNGYELMATLKGQAAYRNIPIVIITSRAGEKHQRKAMEMGASEYVVKPYQDEALLDTVQRLVQESKRAIAA